MHAENKSTNVRFIDGVRWLARRSPGATSRLATRVFFMPPRPRRYAWTDPSVFRGAERLPLDANELALRAWRFGRGPQVLVQHGWGGRTAQMTPLIADLVAAGYSVLALDAPGHGDSGWRSRSSIVHFSKAVDQLLERHGPAFASVAHSLGASAVAHSQACGAATGPLVLIAPFSKPERFYQGFMSHLGFDAEATAAAQQRAEAELGVRFADLDLARNLAASPAPTWIIHDRSDKRVPFHGSERVATKVPGLHLHATDGLGHGRVLADTDVHRVIVNALDALPGPRVVVGSSPSSSTRVFVPTMGELLADLEYGRA